jgi:hypothetical protein
MNEKTEAETVEPAPTLAPTPPVPVVHRIFSESMSPTIGKLATSLAKAQGDIANGVKDKQGYGYKYLQLPSMIEIVRKPLTENGQLSSAQMEGVAATYGRRYSMQALCLLAAEDDDDATKQTS